MSSEARISADPASRSLAALSPDIASLFPPGVAAAELRTPGDPARLDPAEHAAVARAVESRAREFAAGRLCARRALAEIGLDAAVPAASDRQPLWPPGIVGSITHTEGFAAAVVAPCRALAAVGLDTERAGRVKRELWPKICIEEEIAWLESLEAQEQPAAATLIFAAKEAFYKCQYPATGEWLYFADAKVSAQWGSDEGPLRVTPTRPIALLAPDGLSPRVPSLAGRFRRHEGFISAGVFVVSTPARRGTPAGA
jgi:4'-phosphopantetheinyl transferase EntD